jgi:hypothetical protein
MWLVIGIQKLCKGMGLDKHCCLFLDIQILTAESFFDPGPCQADPCTRQPGGHFSLFVSSEKQLAGAWGHIFLQLGHSLRFGLGACLWLLPLGLVPPPPPLEKNEHHYDLWQMGRCPASTRPTWWTGFHPVWYSTL